MMNTTTVSDGQSLVGQATVAFCQQYRPEHWTMVLIILISVVPSTSMVLCRSIAIWGRVAGICTLLRTPHTSVSNYVLTAAELLALGRFILDSGFFPHLT